MSLAYTVSSLHQTADTASVRPATPGRVVPASVQAMGIAITAPVSVMWPSAAANVKCMAALERYTIVLYTDHATVPHKPVCVCQVSVSLSNETLINVCQRQNMLIAFC